MVRRELEFKSGMSWNSNRKNQTMQPTEIALFAVTLFLALTALITWKRRRDAGAGRVNRGLRGYVAAKSTVVIPGPAETHRENLIPVLQDLP
jgi:hypothetical protein